MTESEHSVGGTAKEAIKPVKTAWKLFGEPIASTVKEQYTSSKLYSLFDNLATRFPRSQILSTIKESLKKKQGL